MPALSRTVQQQVRGLFAAMQNPVTLAVFTQATGDDSSCEMCDDTEELVEELAGLSDGKVATKHYDIDRDAEIAREYGVDKVPAVLVLGGEQGRVDFGIRFFGAPMGYEFGTLIEDIRMASTGATGLSDDTTTLLARLASPLRIQVFVTPTCPYCPRAVLLAHSMAMASRMVTAEAVDASEFPELADRYRVHGVPRTVINDAVHIEGAVPEQALIAEMMPLLRAAS